MKIWIDSGAVGGGPSVPVAPKIKNNTGLGDSGGAAVGYQGMKTNSIVLGEFGPERLNINNGWQQVTPSLPAFDSAFHGGNSDGGATNVFVYLDSDKIAARVITKNAKKLYRDRKR